MTVDHSGSVHLCECDGTTVRVSHNHESAPSCILGWPEDWYSLASRLLLPCIWVLHIEAKGCGACRQPCRENASLIVATIVAVQDHSTRRTPHNDDDLVLEQDRKAESGDIKRPCLFEASDKEDQAVEGVDVHFEIEAITSCHPPLNSGWVETERRAGGGLWKRSYRSERTRLRTSLTLKCSSAPSRRIRWPRGPEEGVRC